MSFLRILSLMTCIFASPVTAQNSVDQMLAQGRYGDALTATDRLLQTAPAAPDVHLMRGYALLGLGQVAAAKIAADQAASGQGQFLYATLRGHIATQDAQHNIANFWYRRAHGAATLPAETQTAIHFSRQAQGLRRWVWGAQISTQSSDNLNFATDQDTVRLGGIPFTLHKDNTAQAGTAIAATFSSKYKAVNTATHLMQLGLRSTLSFQQGDGLTSRSFDLTLDGQYRVADDDLPFTLSYGLTAGRSFPTGAEASTTRTGHLQVSGPVNAHLNWSARLTGRTFQNALYWQNDLGLRVGINGTFAGGHSYDLGLTRGRVLSDNPNVAATYQTAQASFNPQIDALPATVSLAASYSSRDYTQQTPFFGGFRTDATSSYSISFAPKDFSVMGFTPSVTLRRTQRNSNVDINDATSQDVFVGLHSNF